ncbi:MAG: TIGR00266 family protein [Oscillospiraceae bacterium]|nr:TIGR00266 family protein [Oscillospiraceae bacterium]
MTYEIKGGNLPVLVLHMEAGEQVMCEGGAMSWMDDGIEMRTEGGGFGKVMGRLFTNESLFQNRYIAQRQGEIAFASKFPGSIIPVQVTPDHPIIVQKGSYLASVGNVSTSVYFHKKFAGGLFGGEGFILTQISGSGMAFLEIDGSAIEYQLAPGQRKILDTGYLAMMDATCSMDVETVKGAKNIFLGGEGLFNTVVTGPGKIVVQTMPLASAAAALSAYLTVAKSD